MKKTLAAAQAIVLALGLFGCGGGPVYRFTATSAPQPPKAPGCTFAISNSPPDPQHFQELGALDPLRQPSRRLDIFKKHAAPAVCAAGGDLVVPEVNSYGLYMRGIVYRQL